MYRGYAILSAGRQRLTKSVCPLEPWSSIYLYHSTESASVTLYRPCFHSGLLMNFRYVAESGTQKFIGSSLFLLSSPFCRAATFAFLLALLQCDKYPRRRISQKSDPLVARVGACMPKSELSAYGTSLFSCCLKPRQLHAPEIDICNTAARHLSVA